MWFKNGRIIGWVYCLLPDAGNFLACCYLSVLLCSNMFLACTLQNCVVDSQVHEFHYTVLAWRRQLAVEIRCTVVKERGKQLIWNFSYPLVRQVGKKVCWSVEFMSVHAAVRVKTKWVALWLLDLEKMWSDESWTIHEPPTVISNMCTKVGAQGGSKSAYQEIKIFMHGTCFRRGMRVGPRNHICYLRGSRGFRTCMAKIL